MTKRLFLFVLFIHNSLLFSQTEELALRLTDAEVIKTEQVIDTISGKSIQMTRITLVANTKVQMSCNYGDPSKNSFETIKNKIAVSFAYDSTGIVKDSMLQEIKKYITEQEAWAKKYNSGSDFSKLPFRKSFFVNKEQIVPFIKTDGENPGDYQQFYLGREVYKIELLERNGLGCLSSFVKHNMYFTQNKKQIELGEYITNVDFCKEIAEKYKVKSKITKLISFNACTYSTQTPYILSTDLKLDEKEFSDYLNGKLVLAPSHTFEIDIVISNSGKCCVAKIRYEENEQFNYKDAEFKKIIGAIEAYSFKNKIAFAEGQTEKYMTILIYSNKEKKLQVSALPVMID